MSGVISGGCLCGNVRYEVRGKLRDVIACHCEQCRRTSGHFVAATACRRPAFTLVKAETLKWYVAVPGFRRGFCGECGSSLFFEEEGGERVSIAAGSLDEPQGLTLAAHIFASEAGDYYKIDDSVPISAKGAHNIALP
ncbi:MAG TPA: GFA family protein [Steroidobacteraceae bacterium]|nr:GFA family protein [Steroidobacteraceae bacterium]